MEPITQEPKLETRPTDKTQPIIPSAPPVSLSQETVNRFGSTISPPALADTGEFYAARYKTREEADRGFEEKERLIGEQGQKLGKAELELQRLREDNARLYGSMNQTQQRRQPVQEEPEIDYGDFYTDPVGVLKKHGDHLMRQFTATMQKQQQEQNEQNIIAADFTQKQTDLHPYEKFVRDRKDQLMQQGWNNVGAYQQAVADVRSAMMQFQPQQPPPQSQPQYSPSNYQPQYQQPPQQPPQQYQTVPNLMPSQMVYAPPMLEQPVSPREMQARTGQYRMNLLRKRTDDNMGWYNTPPM